MKKLFVLTTLSFFLIGCNMNPNKEARIQQLESEMQESIDQINKLEKRIQTLEVYNEQLRTKILTFEKE